jgi:acid stress chaperone HdeB
MDLLMAKRIILALAASLVASSASAQVTIDVAKITCNQYLQFTVADPRDIAIWLSGYYHGKDGSTVLQVQEFKQNVDKLKSACFLRENADRLVMEVIEKVLLIK